MSPQEGNKKVLAALWKSEYFQVMKYIRKGTLLNK
jgi:hypothetical protein